MLYFYWKQSREASSPTSVLQLQLVQDAVGMMVDLWGAERQHEFDNYPTGPLFDCKKCNEPYRYDGLPRDGKGNPTNVTAGLTWTAFRPSDERSKFGYVVPSNMFAVVALNYAAEMASKLWNNGELSRKAATLAVDIERGIREHAVVAHPDFGRIYAYEVDGLGNSLFADDPTVPSLLSIPYLGYQYDTEVYANTRRYILSTANPEFRKASNPITGEIEGYGINSVDGDAQEGTVPESAWPMAIAVQALTTDNVDEKVHLVEQLVKASAGTGRMHESFDIRNPAKFTRSWFCWADSLFAELVLSLTDFCLDESRKYTVNDWRDPVTVQGGIFATA